MNNGGKLILENIGKGKNPKRQYDSGMGLGNVLFPVGTTNGTSYSYTPVYINNRDQRQATVNATFAVTVTDGVYSGGSDGTKYGFNAVNKTWSVSVLFGDADAEGLASLDIFYQGRGSVALGLAEPAVEMVFPHCFV